MKVIDFKKTYDPYKNRCQEFAHEVKERYVLYGGAKGGGKTAWGINEGIRLSMEYPGNVGFMGCRDGTDFKRNALSQLYQFLPSELYSSFDYTDSAGVKRHAEGSHNKQEQCFRLINGSTIFYGGIGSESEADRKINNMPTMGWVFIDQAEEISELQFLKLDGQIRLMLPGIVHKFLLTANPDPGWLRSRFIEEHLPDHIFIPALPGDNPYLPPDYADRLRKQYPEEMVKRLLEGDWDVPSANALIPYDNIRQAITRDMPAAGVKIAGLDVAALGGANTVYILRQGNKVLKILSWNYMDTDFSAGKVAELIREDKPLWTYIDGIGVGGEVYALLKADNFPVKKVIVSEESTNKELYVNKRAEYYGKLAKRFEMGEISIPDHHELAGELNSIKKRYKGTQLLIESKDAMRKRGFHSPDFADALMLAFIQGENVPKSSFYVAGRRVF